MSTPEIVIKPENRYSWDEWRKTRYLRRMLGKRVAPAIVRREESSSDQRLRGEFEGDRGPGFATDEQLKQLAEALGGPTDIEAFLAKRQRQKDEF